MTVTMTTKNQITIPKKIVDALDLGKGALLDVHITGNRIEIIPLEVTERVYTDQNYKRLDKLVNKEKKSAKKVTKKFIDSIK